MLYGRGDVWWYKFQFAGRLFRESTKTSSKTLARQAERKRHQRLEEAIHGICKRTPPIRFVAAADDWRKLKRPTWAVTSYEVEKRNLKHLKPAFSSRSIFPIATLALHTGMRKGEIQSLRWKQIDFLERSLTVGATKTAAGTGRVNACRSKAYRARIGSHGDTVKWVGKGRQTTALPD